MRAADRRCAAAGYRGPRRVSQIPLAHADRWRPSPAACRRSMARSPPSLDLTGLQAQRSQCRALRLRRANVIHPVQSTCERRFLASQPSTTGELALDAYDYTRAPRRGRDTGRRVTTRPPASSPWAPPARGRAAGLAQDVRGSSPLREPAGPGSERGQPGVVRERGSGRRRVTNPELFFDSSYGLRDHATVALPPAAPEGYPRAARLGLLLARVWLLWAYTTCVTNWFADRSGPAAAAGAYASSASSSCPRAPDAFRPAGCWWALPTR